MNDIQAEKLGNEIIKLLNLQAVRGEKIDGKKVYRTTGWGTKTPLGLGRVIERLTQEAQEDSE